MQKLLKYIWFKSLLKQQSPSVTLKINISMQNSNANIFDWCGVGGEDETRL